MANMSITFHGAALRVTGSMSLVTCGDSRLLVDCGMIQRDDQAAGLAGCLAVQPDQTVEV